MTSLIRRSNDMFDIIDNIFNISYPVSPTSSNGWRYTEDSGVINLEVDLPGYSKSDINVESSNNVLTIKNGDTVLKNIKVSKDYDSNKAKAELKNGRLYVKIKGKEHVVKKIPVT